MNVLMVAQLSTEDTPVSPVEAESSRRNPLANLRQRLALNNYILPTDMEDIKAFLKAEPPLAYDDALQIIELCGAKMPDVPKSERTATALYLWKYFERQRWLRLDTRICNALLTAHLDNDHGYSPKEFLAWMRSVGIEADAATFSLFIERYCNAGDIGGATATLEVMRARDMKISRSVFHSLIRCNALMGKIEEANRVMDVMRGGGLDVLGDTRSALIDGMIRSGRKWEDVKPVLVGVMNTEGVRIQSKEMYDIIMALARAKEFAAAEEVLVMMRNQPKEKGYFWIVRSAIPQAIFEGATDLALDMYATLDRRKRHKPGLVGEFIFRALVTMEVKPDIFGDLIEKSKHMNEKSHSVELNPNKPEPNLNNNDNLLAMKVLELCINMGKLKYAQEVSAMLRHKFGSEMFKTGKHDFLIRRNMLRLADPVEQILFILGLDSVGIRPSMDSLANDIVPKLLEEGGDDPTYMLAILSDVLSSVGQKSWNEMANAVVRFLLNKETVGGFNEVLHFAFTHSFVLWPSGWHASLARAYLVTGDADGLVAVIVQSDLVQRDHKKAWSVRVLHYIHQNAHMYKPDQDPDRVLLVALKAIQRARVGLPGELCEGLRSTVKDPETLKTLDILREMGGAMADYWTRSRIQEAATKLNLKYAGSKGVTCKGGESRSEAGRRYRVSDKSLEKMEQLQRRLCETDIGHEQW